MAGTECASAAQVWNLNEETLLAANAILGDRRDKRRLLGMHGLLRARPCARPAHRSAVRLPLRPSLSALLPRIPARSASGSSPHAAAVAYGFFDPRRVVLPGSSGAELAKQHSRTRYLLVPVATLNHVCLGSVFAWSMFNQPLMRLLGVVAPAAADWTLGDVTLTFSLIMGGFAWGAVFSKHLDRMGPRLCSLLGALSLGGGFAGASLASYAHSLPLLYLSGLVWGVANGVAYVPPIAALMRWFPDRKGFASGCVVVGYGGGALVAAPLFERLLAAFRRAPERVGGMDSVAGLVNDGGALFAQSPGGRVQVVVASLQDAAALGVEPGVFAVGTGSTGVAETLAALGAAYAAVMALAALGHRLPSREYEARYAAKAPGAPAPGAPAPGAPAPSLPPPPDLTVSEATRTRQFALLYFGFGCASAGAYALISSSKLILATGFPGVPPAFLTSFVAATSIANLTGRLAYSNLSDYLARTRVPGAPFVGRRAAYTIMWGVAPLGYLGVARAIDANAGAAWEHSSAAPVGLFCASAFVIMSSFGGSAATRPAIVSDMFGVANTSALSARQLSVILPSSFLGPKLVAVASERATERAARALAESADPVAFEACFKAPLERFDELLSAKTVTLSRLLEICPPGTPDPGPFVFHDAMFAAAGLTGVALVINRLTTMPSCSKAV